jgi:hypothetical protein
MQIISHHEVLSPGIPRTLARALRRVAARDGVPVSVTIKRLLTDALIAEGEIEVTPTPRPRAKRIARIDTGAVDDGGNIQ